MGCQLSGHLQAGYSTAIEIAATTAGGKRRSKSKSESGADEDEEDELDEVEELQESHWYIIIRSLFKDTIRNFLPLMLVNEGRILPGGEKIFDFDKAKEAVIQSLEEKNDDEKEDEKDDEGEQGTEM